MRAKRSLYQRIVMWLRGIVWQSADGKTKLLKNGWIVTSDGESSDAIPYHLCSEALLYQIIEETGKGKWVHCSPELLQSGVSCAATPRRPCQCGLNGSHDHFVATT